LGLCLLLSLGIAGKGDVHEKDASRCVGECHQLLKENFALPLNTNLRNPSDSVSVFHRFLGLDTTVNRLDGAARRPNSVSPAYAFQLATYRQITSGASGEARLDTLVKTKTVQLVSHSYTVNEQDLRSTEVIYPLVQEGMRSGLYYPNRNSFTCSRRNCAFWRKCEAEYGGTVEF
jgi:hypothetical protein